MSTFLDALAAGPVVLDGGLGTHLETNGHDLSSSLWSARLLLEDPGAIRDAHVDFFRAGAQVAITASYQVSYDGLDAAGYRRAEVDRLLADTVRLAREAQQESGAHERSSWVAASVGPFGASRADGSEYTGDYGLTVAQLREWHRPRLHALVAAAPDALAVETLPSLAEIEAVCRETESLGVPTWIALTVADGRMRTGESLAEGLALAASFDAVVAVGVNCCAVGEVDGALAVARSASSKPAVAYPNSGELWLAESRSWSGESGSIGGRADDWLTAGAGLLGGCCRVGPDQIADVARAVGSRAA